MWGSRSRGTTRRGLSRGRPVVSSMANGEGFFVVTKGDVDSSRFRDTTGQGRNYNSIKFLFHSSTCPLPGVYLKADCKAAPGKHQISLRNPKTYEKKGGKEGTHPP